QRVAGLVDPRLAHVQDAVAVAVPAGRTRHTGAGVGLDLVADTGPGQADVAGVLDRDGVVDDVAGAVRRAVRNGGRLADGEGRVVDQGHRGGGRVRAALVGGRRGLVVQRAVPVVVLSVQLCLGQRVAGLVDPRLTHV